MLGSISKILKRPRYTGPGSSPGTGGLPPKKETRYTGPGSSPGTGGISNRTSARKMMEKLMRAQRSQSASQYQSAFR